MCTRSATIFLYHPKLFPQELTREQLEIECEKNQIQARNKDRYLKFVFFDVLVSLWFVILKICIYLCCQVCWFSSSWFPRCFWNKIWKWESFYECKRNLLFCLFGSASQWHQESNRTAWSDSTKVFFEILANLSN